MRALSRFAWMETLIKYNAKLKNKAYGRIQVEASVSKAAPKINNPINQSMAVLPGLAPRTVFRNRNARGSLKASVAIKKALDEWVGWNIQWWTHWAINGAFPHAKKNLPVSDLSSEQQPLMTHIPQNGSGQKWVIWGEIAKKDCEVKLWALRKAHSMHLEWHLDIGFWHGRDGIRSGMGCN